MAGTADPATSSDAGAAVRDVAPAGPPVSSAFGPSAYAAAPPTDRLTQLVDRLRARAPRWLAPLAVLSCIGGAVAFTELSNPTAGSPDATPTCLVKLTTGLDCPGCGGTRAAWYLLHGDLGAAARHHLVFVFAVPFLIYLYVAWTAQAVFGRRLPRLRVTPLGIGLFLGGWLVFSVLRNLPWAPFSWFYV
jgi:hypothetical protein